MRFELWNCESLDAVRLSDLVYYSSAGFLSFKPASQSVFRFSSAHLCEHVIWRGPEAPGSGNLALANTLSKWAPIDSLWRLRIDREFALPVKISKLRHVECLTQCPC
jgi:hypothetical protein